MIPTFRAWNKLEEDMCEVITIDFWLENVYTYCNEYDEEKRNYFDDVELMQSTGLKDKNDKEIFEGDIFEYPHLGIIRAVVVYKNGSWYLDKLGLGTELELLWTECENGEVLGNIYENSELLEVKS